jgi:Tfp pilus assembly protein PilO
MNNDNKWHLSKAISVSHLVTTFALVLAGVIYITGIEKDVAVLEAKHTNLQQQIAQMESDNKAMFEKIDDKLDSLMDYIVDMRKKD